jgi:hypothetical protein
MLLCARSMNLRITLVALSMFVVGCGAGGELNPGTHRDPVTYCGGLTRNACETAPECYVEPANCITLCVDDGSGNCGSPCAGEFRCLPAPVTCESLDEQACAADSRCESIQYACPALCLDDGHGGCVPCQGPGSICVTRTPASCESLDVNACATDARCEVIPYACAAVCIDDGHGGCVPCTAPANSCRTREVSCYGLSPDACDQHPECEFIARDACACAPGALCDCPAIEPSCQPRQVNPVNCYGLSPDECDQNSECEFVSRTTCDCTGALCDCPAIEPSCQPRQVTPVACYGLSPDECDQHSECEFVSRNACDCTGALCDCPAIEPSCQPRQVTPVACYGLSPDECDLHSECEFVSRDVVCDCAGPDCTCPAIEPSCQPRTSCESLSPSECVNVPGCGLLETDCGCPEGAACDCALQARCVSTTQPQPDPCAGLDLATCTTDSRCEIGALVCTTECRDDGNGGCLPCPDTAVCQLKAEEPPVAGCGAPPAP